MLSGPRHLSTTLGCGALFKSTVLGLDVWFGWKTDYALADIFRDWLPR
jgi:hypothetical protein